MESDLPPLAAPMAGRGHAVRSRLYRWRWWFRVVLALAAMIVFAWVLSHSSAAVWHFIKSHLEALQGWVRGHRVEALVGYFLAYSLITSLPLPLVTIMCLLAGALFGRWVGTPVALAAYTTGVTTAFLTSRWLLHDWVRRRFRKLMPKVDRHVKRDGVFYLLSLRLIPSVPYFVVNWLMALTPIRTGTFAVVSAVGMIPMTFLLTGLGTELATLESPSDILSPGVILSLLALGVAPLLLKGALYAYARWVKCHHPMPSASGSLP